ncbi:MAG TPA: DUF6351 family protein [Paucimonas sp.]|nr:DUF6351 family protein [Paucimonas sp.]HJW54610.1 DUF6351 family protein [Burkholderiaceae bacterium]
MRTALQDARMGHSPGGTRISLRTVVGLMLVTGVMLGCGGGGGGGGSDTPALPLVPGTPNTPGLPVSPGSSDNPASAPSVQLLSSRADYVTGGTALIDILLPALPASGSAPALTATLNGAEVTGAFKPDPTNPRHFSGVVSGLQNGANTLVASTGGASASLGMTNYPITGPVISGPQITPFICQTQDFLLPDGSPLGTADANCSAPTRVVYLYQATSGGALKPLPAATTLPVDVAMATTSEGKAVPFVVRVETGTMNRGIYQNAVLHNPAADAAPSPMTPPPGWNRRLIALQGSGCTGGWYLQGSSLGANLLSGDNLVRLGEGYALFGNSLTHPANDCNAIVAGESAMMGKEHVIKTLGVPLWTASIGSSGGAYTSLQIADAFPGLFDGVFVSQTFPDTLTLANAALDARLLSNYFFSNNVAGFTEAQMVAVSGHKSARAWYDLALQAGRTDPVPGRSDPTPASPSLGAYQSAVWNPAVPGALRYAPLANPRGARPTIFDVARNLYGIDPATGFALRPFDNTGVQYGLEALNAGLITAAQFLDLNQRIGGYDQDANLTAARSIGDPGAIRRAYQSGLLLGGSGGLATIPVFDLSGTYDEDQAYHYQWFHFAVRERLAQANGGAQNHVMWRGDPAATSGASAQALANQGWTTFIQWMDAYKADASAASQRDKVIGDKPAAAVDGCFTRASNPQFIAEPQTFGSQPNTQCNQWWPSYGFPRKAAGGELAANRLKCQLKPISTADYAVVFTAAQLTQLNAVFPGGVCDWSKPGVNQTPVVPDPSFGPSPVNRVFDITSPG